MPLSIHVFLQDHPAETAETREHALSVAWRALTARPMPVRYFAISLFLSHRLPKSLAPEVAVDRTCPCHELGTVPTWARKANGSVLLLASPSPALMRRFWFPSSEPRDAETNDPASKLGTNRLCARGTETAMGSDVLGNPRCLDGDALWAQKRGEPDPPMLVGCQATAPFHIWPPDTSLVSLRGRPRPSRIVIELTAAFLDTRKAPPTMTHLGELTCTVTCADARRSST